MADDKLKRLESLDRLLNDGRITPEEFETLKAEIVAEQQPAPIPATEQPQDLGRRSIVIGVVVVLVLVGIIWAVQESNRREAERDRAIRDLVDIMEGGINLLVPFLERLFG